MANVASVTTICDRRLVSAFLIFATGVSAVVLVEKLQSYSPAPLAAYARWFIARPRAESSMVFSLATGGAVVTANRFTAPFGERGWLLPDSEVCR